MEKFTEEFKCDICEKDFSNRQKLRTHKNGVHKHGNSEAMYLWSICTKSYQTKPKLTFHTKTVHAE